MANTDVKKCFVICPIGEEGSDVRKRSDQILKHLIRPVAEECSYNVDRADKIGKPGIITSQIIDRLIHDDLVIADLTGGNPNVYYELAVRHAVRKPVILLIHGSEALPFDISPNRVIKYDHLNWDSKESCASELKEHIKCRVAQGIAPLSPHGTGLADFPHPALQVYVLNTWTGYKSHALSWVLAKDYNPGNG